jgi:YidC/Oxa1 family membrane protein insertase
MNNPRVLLWAALAAILLLNYQAWMKDYGATSSSAAPPAASGTASPNPSAGKDSAVPQKFATEPGASAAPVATSPAAENVEPAAENAPRVHVRTDVLDMDISLQGGTITRADLLRYPRVKGSTQPVRLMNEDSALTWYVLNSGIAGPGNAHPTQSANFTSANSQYDLGSAAQLIVPLSWNDGHGVSVTKTFTFRRGDYRIDLQYAVDNRSSEPWQGATYGQIQRYDEPVARSYFNVEGNASHGPAVGDGTKYRFLSIDKPENRTLDIEARGGWIAAVQLYFVGAVVPEAGSKNRITLSTEERKFQLTATGPLRTLAPDTADTFKETLFVGPKLHDQLAAMAPYLDRVADYGTFTLIALPLFWLLGKVHGFFGNWGVAIIVVTFLLKLLFYPLSEASGRSMAKMKTLAPRIKNLQDMYKDDKEKLGRAMMELYKREKVNPVAGCLPIIIQIPVFLAFYWVLLESVEMRQAPFAGWIHDLSARDPAFILPAIMAAAMLVQYKLNPTPPDPVQAKVFLIMPLVMSATFAFFPAGLVLYWVTNTLLSIAQQWNINRRIATAAAKRTD